MRMHGFQLGLDLSLLSSPAEQLYALPLRRWYQDWLFLCTPPSASAVHGVSGIGCPAAPEPDADIDLDLVHRMAGVCCCGRSLAPQQLLQCLQTMLEPSVQHFAASISVSACSRLANMCAPGHA